MTPSDTRAPDAPESLRDRHKETTRTTILHALADIISEGNVHGFTVQEVADRACVSHRTVYRHFANREELLEALAEWLDWQLGRHGTPVRPRTLDEVSRSVRAVFPHFDEYAPMVRALAITYAATGVRPATREARTDAFRRVIDEALPHLDEEERRRFFAVTRVLTNSQTWQVFHDHLGMNGHEAGAAVAWAVEVLSDQMKRRNDRRASTNEDPGARASADTGKEDTTDA